MGLTGKYKDNINIAKHISDLLCIETALPNIQWYGQDLKSRDRKRALQ